jgi:hypothetical protein
VGQDLQATASLLVAASDLQLVRLLRGAMRTADLSSGAAGGGFGPAAVIEPRPRHHPDPLIEPRPRIHPTPRFEPRPVIHPTPRFEPRPVIRPEPRVDAPAYPCVVLEIVVDPCDSNCPIEPPWRVLPWEPGADVSAQAESLAQPAHRVKPPIRRPDIVGKGALIDLFC